MYAHDFSGLDMECGCGALLRGGECPCASHTVKCPEGCTEEAASIAIQAGHAYDCDTCDGTAFVSEEVHAAWVEEQPEAWAAKRATKTMAQELLRALNESGPEVVRAMLERKVA